MNDPKRKIGKKPYGSRLRRSFLAAVLGMTIAVGGVVLGPEDNAAPAGGTLLTQDTGGGPADQMWAASIATKSFTEQRTDLYAAANFGQGWRLRTLVNSPDFAKGATAVEKRSALGYALNISANGGRPDMVETLLKAGADPNFNFGMPMVLAAKYGADNKSVDLLVRSGGSINDAFFTAYNERDFKVMDNLWQRSEFSFSVYADSLLYEAAMNSDVEMAEYLLEKNVMPDQNAFMAAVNNGNRFMTQMFLEEGASAAMLENAPLKAAIMIRDPEMIVMLRIAGATPDQAMLDTAKAVDKDVYGALTTKLPLPTLLPPHLPPGTVFPPPMG